MKNKLFTMAGAVAAALLTHATTANAINFTFLENGSNTGLGVQSTFTVSGLSLTAYGFDSVGNASDLYAKDGGVPAETGLGMVTDLGGDNEIDVAHFVQLDLQNLIAGNMGLGSIQTLEDAGIYGSNILGDIGTHLADIANGGGDVNSYDLSGFGYRYVGVTAVNAGNPEANVLITGLSATSSVPDGGMTIALLGMAVSGLGLISRKLRA